MPPVYTIYTADGCGGSTGRASIEHGNKALDELRLFRTESGLVGKGPQTVVAGDEVWVFPGGSVPFLLRCLRRGKYSLVGHAYVHGIMHGELVDELKTKPPEDIILL